MSFLHELPITQQIIKIVSEKANGVKVKSVTLVVGDNCGFISSSIQMYFDEISKDTACDGASLLIERVKNKLICEGCGKYFERRPYSFECPDCGKMGMPTEIGKEFYIKEIEV